MTIKEAQFNTLFENMIHWSLECKLLKESPALTPELIKNIANDLANQLTNDPNSPLRINNLKTPRDLLDSKNANLLHKLLVPLLINAIIKKHAPDGLKNLTDENKTALQEELRNTLTMLFSFIKNSKALDMAVNDILDKVLGKNFAPRPKGPKSSPEDLDLQVNRTPKLYPVLAVADDGTVVAFEGIYTPTRSNSIEHLSDIERKGELDELRFVLSTVFAKEMELQDLLHKTVYSQYTPTYTQGHH